LDDVSINGQTDGFSTDPGWDARGNRATYTTFSVRPRFDFGFSKTHFADGNNSGELGGTVFRGDNRFPGKVAYYGDRLDELSAAKPLQAAGKVSLRRGVSDSTSLIGFFHSQDSVAVSDAQTSGFPMNFLGIAIEGPSSEGFYFYPAHRFPNGADAYARGADSPHILPDGRAHEWSLVNDPEAGGGAGRLTVTLDDRAVHLDLATGHRNAPARFDRFGIVTTWIDGNAQTVYFDDLTYTFRQSP
jgi:hypothetical protein